MNLTDIATLRLKNQQLTRSRFTTPENIVRYLGAVQAQDYPMAKWSLGVRLPSSTNNDIEAAIADARIVRTHLLRPTWHFAAAEDIYWMLDLSAAQIKMAQSYREKQLELTAAVFTSSNRLIEKKLGEVHQCTRDELIEALNSAGIRTDKNRASHLLAHAELDKIICSGKTRGNKISYALLSERVPHPHLLSREEALGELARRYFTSRAPVTLADFTWWSGLPSRDASLALELVKSNYSSETLNGQKYWLPKNVDLEAPAPSSVLLLPNYDEFIISYTDRSASIPVALELHMKEISDRGVFWPILVVDGQVVGIWKRTFKRDLLNIEIQPFSPLEPTLKELVSQAAETYAGFLGMQMELDFQK